MQKMMENYEDFYRRCVYRVKEEGLHRTRSRRTPSVIHFHGRPLLQPVLSEEQRIEMAKQRQKAVERESEKLKSSPLLTRVQDILNYIQLQKMHNMTQPAEGCIPDPQALSSMRTHLEDQSVTNFTPNFSSSSDRRREILKLLNSRMERVEKKEQEEKQVEGKRRSSWPNSLANVKKMEDKAGRTNLALQCFKNVETHTLMKSSSKCEETLADKNESCELERPLVVVPSVDCSSSTDLKSICSPLTSLSFSASLMGSYAQLPSPQPSCGPLTHRLKTAGDILFSEWQPSKTNMENSVKRLTKSVKQSESLTAPSSGGDVICYGSELSSKKHISVSTSTPSSTPTHTQLGPTQHSETDRQSHSAPYQRPPPAPLNQSYDVENPSPSLLRPQISLGPEPLPGSVRCRLERRGWLQRPLKDSTTPGHLHEPHTLQNKAGDEANKQILISGAPQQPLEKQHADPHLFVAQETRSPQQVCVEQDKAVCYLTAMARGFLTRRLLQTEKIKHLRKTIQDSRGFIRSFQADAQQRRASFTPQDLLLQHRVRAQLRAALCDMHGIFFVWPVRKRLALLKQDRELRNQRRLRETEKGKSLRDRHNLSSATQKSLDQKKQGRVVRKTVKSRSSLTMG